MTSDEARVRPVFALESGPAAGVVAAQAIARQLGRAQAISFDMGGTTAKASLIEHGEILRCTRIRSGRSPLGLGAACCEVAESSCGSRRST